MPDRTLPSFRIDDTASTKAESAPAISYVDAVPSTELTTVRVRPLRRETIANGQAPESDRPSSSVRLLATGTGHEPDPDLPPPPRTEPAPNAKISSRNRSAGRYAIVHGKAR